MAEAMQTSVAHRELLKHLKLEASDTESRTIAQVVLAEHMEALDLDNTIAFAKTIAARADWGVKMLPLVPVEFKCTRMFLFNLIVNAWVNLWGAESHHSWSVTLRNWNERDSDEASKVLSAHIQGTDLHPESLVKVLAYFFVSEDRNGLPADSKLWRAVAKAIGHRASMEELEIMGRVLHLMQGEKRDEVVRLVNRSFIV